jgi:protein-tyrosine phosphatase/arsenate reductase
MFSILHQRCIQLVKNFSEIPVERKATLEKIAGYISTKKANNETVQLEFVCTHNSRRSHLGQIWAAVAAAHYHIENVQTFSGGTEATAFNPNAIHAVVSAGFEVRKTTEGINPVFHVFYDDEKFVTCFSKVYNHESNPNSNFAAIMTCSDAEENCPFIPGCDLRIATTYNDPKAYDGTVLQDEKYTERSNQIAMECLYIFSKIIF